jgi:hypothetical protein
VSDRCDVCLQETDSGLTCEDCMPDITEEREAGRAEAIAEIVADLRAMGDGSWVSGAVVKVLADRYERGEHRKEKPDGE